MAAALTGDFSNATDLADDLAAKGLPFRQAHEVVGLVVRDCISRHQALEALSLEELRAYSPLFDTQTLKKIQHGEVMHARRSAGGTGPDAVRQQLKAARAKL